MKYLGIVVVILALFACENEKPKEEVARTFLISGKIDNADSAMTYLLKMSDSWEAVDSTLIIDGSFEFTGSVAEPEIHFIRIGSGGQFRKAIFLENDTFQVNGDIDDFSNTRVAGGQMQNRLNQMNDSMAAYRLQEKALYEEYEKAELKNDLAEMAKLDSMWEALNKEQNAFLKNLALNNSDNAFGPYVTINTSLNYNLSLVEFEEIFATLDTTMQGGKYYEALSEKVNKLQNSAVGKQMPAFEQADSTGNLISSDQFRGKYLLIDFWASWCGPCRRENPNVVAMYNEIKDKGEGLEILGVSLDENKMKWIKAIEDDSLTWYHVSDLKGWSNEVAKQYAIESIPHTILVDPKGVIISKNLSGEALYSKLDSLLASTN